MKDAAAPQILLASPLQPQDVVCRIMYSCSKPNARNSVRIGVGQPIWEVGKRVWFERCLGRVLMILGVSVGHSL